MGAENPEIIQTEIDSPDYLQEGQNLYDQRPFSDAISQVSELTHFPDISLRFGLSHVTPPPAPIGHRPSTWEAQRKRWSNECLWEITNALGAHTNKLSAQVREELRSLDRFKDLTKLDLAEQLTVAALKVVDVLEATPAPLWRRYLNTKRNNYNSLGEYHERGQKVNFPERTYATWLQGQQVTPSKEARLWGINEIFTRPFHFGRIIANFILLL